MIRFDNRNKRYRYNGSVVLVPQAWIFNINLFILAGGSPNHFVLRPETPLNVQQEQHEFFEGFPLLFQV